MGGTVTKEELFKEFMTWKEKQAERNIVEEMAGFLPPARVAPAVIYSEKFKEWQARAKDTDTYRVIVTPDAQFPYEDIAANDAVEQYIRDNRFDEWIDLGDFMDFDFLSRHNEGMHRLNAGKLLKQHYTYGKQVLDRRLEVLHRNNKRATMTMIEGNHDARVEAFLDKNPQLEGLLEVEEGLGLRKRKIQWIRFWRDGSIYKIGKAGFCHGLYTSKYHAAKMVENYCCNIFYGHVHDVMEFPKVMHGTDEVVVGQSLGCLCRLDQAYIKQNPKNWQLAFGDFFFRKSGLFTYYVPRIFDGSFVAPTGQVYVGKA